MLVRVGAAQVRGALVALALSACAASPSRPPVAELDVPALRAKPEAPPKLDPEETIGPGGGPRGLKVGAHRADLEARFGTPDEVVRHESYSVELRWRFGVTAYFCTSDETERIFHYVIRPPFRARTEKGIVLGTSTMKDVFGAYGEGRWTASEGSPEWHVEYEGIGFSVEREQSLPQYPIDEALHLARTLTAFHTFQDDDAGGHCDTGGG
jgi:hypothetical protein